ncbi:MAG: hypothetical protein QM564_05725, partial [Bergeyella sp.]
MIKNFLKPLISVFLILLFFAVSSCRQEMTIYEEANMEKDASKSLDDIRGRYTARKIFPDEFQKMTELNERIETNSKILSQKILTNKITLENAVVDSSYAMETTYGNVVTYTFPVYRKNQGKFFENLVLQ